MPEGFTNISEGSGKKQHSFQRTIGANTVEDNVILNGEPYLATYSVSTGPDLATAASHLFQLMAGASLKLRLRRIELYPVVAATTVTLTTLALVRLTTAGTGGISLTINPLDSTDSAVGATARATPTAKGTEGAILWQGSWVAFQTLPTSGAIQYPIILDFDQMRMKPIIIAAGTANGICLKNATAIAAASILIQVYFDEVNF